jgi:hypothetical protein
MSELARRQRAVEESGTSLRGDPAENRQIYPNYGEIGCFNPLA